MLYWSQFCHFFNWILIALSYFKHFDLIVCTFVFTFFVISIFVIKCQNIVSQLASAKQFLVKNPIKNKTIVNKIYELNVKTLISFIHHNSNNSKKNQNKILKNHKIQIIY